MLAISVFLICDFVNRVMACLYSAIVCAGSIPAYIMSVRFVWVPSMVLGVCGISPACLAYLCSLLLGHFVDMLACVLGLGVPLGCFACFWSSFRRDCAMTSMSGVLEGSLWGAALHVSTRYLACVLIVSLLMCLCASSGGYWQWQCMCIWFPGSLLPHSGHCIVSRLLGL